MDIGHSIQYNNFTISNYRHVPRGNSIIYLTIDWFLHIIVEHKFNNTKNHKKKQIIHNNG